MAFGRAGGRVPQTLAHRLQTFDHGVQFICLGCEQVPVDAGLATGQKHGPDVIQRKTGRLP
ncbi:hypothetical protein D3C72_2398530 [compost metagenome]